MKNVFILLVFFVSSAYGWDDPLNVYQQDAYGLGVHSDQYGRPYTTEPGIQLQQNTYGLGQHSDQYGRPVHPKPYPPQDYNYDYQNNYNYEY